MDLHEANGARFIAADDMIVAWIRRERREFEPETFAWMRAALAGRDGVFVDVGAATGWFSIPFALAGARVVAFEPNPSVFARLAANLALNAATIDARPCAASRVAGSATFMRNPRVPLTSGGSIEVATCARPERLEVETARLDEALVDLSRVALIKIDVEGHEIAVLDGAASTIARDRPHLVLEANTARHRAAIEAWLAGMGGYEIAAADERNLLCAPSVAAESAR